MRRRHLHQRPGFALLAVLWVVSAAALLGVLLASLSRDTVSTATNRVASMRAYWRAEGCVARTRLVLDTALVVTNGADSGWAHLDRVLESPLLADCAVQLEPTGIALDVDAAPAEELGRLLRADDVPSAAADSLVAALLDWIDPDDDPRPDGAEREWYARQRRPPPRNAAFADIRELELVRGFREMARESPSILRHLTTESDRIYLAKAPLAVLAALPGFGPEALAYIAQGREVGKSTLDLASLADVLSPESRAQLLANFSALSGRVTTLPDAWILRVSAMDPHNSLPSRIELRLARAGMRVAVVRHRSDP